MRTVIPLLMVLAAVGTLCGCGRQETPSATPKVSEEGFRVDDALPAEGFVSGWKATPGSYIYSASADELWKIYDGAAPGMVSEGAREAVTQGYENTEGGADRSLRVFVLRFVDEPHALDYLKKEAEGAEGGEGLSGVDAGKIFDKGKAPWVRFVLGAYFVSVNWEGSSEDGENTTVNAVHAIAAKLSAG